jgi:hypothetical protein
LQKEKMPCLCLHTSRHLTFSRCLSKISNIFRARFWRNRCLNANHYAINRFSYRFQIGALMKGLMFLPDISWTPCKCMIQLSLRFQNHSISNRHNISYNRLLKYGFRFEYWWIS